MQTRLVGSLTGITIHRSRGKRYEHAPCQTALNGDPSNAPEDRPNSEIQHIGPLLGTQFTGLDGKDFRDITVQELLDTVDTSVHVLRALS